MSFQSNLFQQQIEKHTAGDMEGNPWTNMSEAQRWVDRKHAQHESTDVELSKCEYMSTTIVTFICCTLIHIYRAIMVTSVASSAKRFHWNALGEITLLLMDVLGYIAIQAPIGYICDNRGDILCSKSGVDRITGEKALTSAVERAMGGAMFGSNNTEVLDVEPWGDKMTNALEGTDVTSDEKEKGKGKSKLMKRFNKLRKHMASQYTKYGPRYVLGTMFILWSITQLVYGVVSAVASSTALIYLFFVLRFIGGALEGGIIVATQALIGKEVVPNRIVEHSQAIALTYPLGCLTGVLLRIHFSDAYGVTVDCITWVAAISLLYSVVVFVWLAGSIDESIDRSDLLQKKEEVFSDVLPKEEKDTGCKSCSRALLRVGLFSYFESVWLVKFRAFFTMAAVNMLYWFTVHTVTSWIPSRVHDHKDFMTEVLAAHIINKHNVNPSGTGLTKEDIVKAAANLATEVPKENPSVDGFHNPKSDKSVETNNSDDSKLVELKGLYDQGLLDEAAYAKAVELVVENIVAHRNLNIEEIIDRRLEDIYIKESTYSRNLLGAGNVIDAATINKSVLEALNAQRQKVTKGHVHGRKVNKNNIKRLHDQLKLIKADKAASSKVALEKYPSYLQYQDGTFDIGAAKVLPMYVGMAISCLIGNAITSFLHRNRYLGAKGARVVPMALGLLLPAALFLYSGIALTNLTNITDLEFDQIFNTASGVFASAIAISGLCLGSLISSQSHTAPFKAGGTFAVINIGAGIGIMLAFFYRALITHIFGDYILLTSLISAGSFVLCFVLWLVASSYDLIEELAPIMSDGSPSKRIKVYK